MFTLGVDIGRRVDSTVICGVERTNDNQRIVRISESIPLMASYQTMAARVAAWYNHLRENGHDVRVYLDATGVGAPVLELVQSLGVHANGVILTAGTSETETDMLRVSKVVLLTRLQILLQTGQIAIPAQATQLITELRRFGLSYTSTGHLQLEATRGHDDHVIALALACHEGGRFPRKIVATVKRYI